MAKPEWGTKRLCQSCGAKFYDMARTPITCPKCAAVYHIEVETRRRPRPAPEPPKKRKEEEIVAKTDDADEAAAPDAGRATEGEEVLEDPADLGEDEEEFEVANDEET